MEDGVEGIIIRAQDLQHIADAVAQVTAVPKLSREIGEAALQKGAGENTWQNYGDRLLNAYLGKLPPNSCHPQY